MSLATRPLLLAGGLVVLGVSLLPLVSPAGPPPTVATSSSAPDGPATEGSEPMSQLLSADEVQFIPLNPARGDASPQAGALWGNIREDVASGSLVRFADGFASPPHIHNITYRAVVLQGEIHNDDPAAERMWMGPGSFWTQPAGELHITAARGEDPLIFLEILSGPYLVRPGEEAFDEGERPVNLVPGNLMWLGAHDSAWIEGDGPAIAHLWGSLGGEGPNGSFLRLPAGHRSTLRTEASLLRLVAVQGAAEVRLARSEGSQPLAPGASFTSRGAVTHQLACLSDAPCLFYLHTEGSYQVEP